MSGELVVAALCRRPDGVAVLPLLNGEVAVVGGFVRDALLGRAPREVDLLVEGDAGAVAAQLAAQAGGQVDTHPRFDTYTVSAEGWQVDIAAARAERYARPGALPEVRPAGFAEDLARRDFTVNAIALLHDGDLLAVPGALDDLATRSLRVLHDASFKDDPTRLVRLARYAERLGFDVDARTAELAAAADFAGLSPARIGAELRRALREPDPAAVLSRLPLAFDAELAARALALAPPEADRDMIMLAACASLPAIEATRAERAVLQGDIAALARRMENAVRPSELAHLLRAEPCERVALAGASGAYDAARRWLEELREIRLEISGEDLIAAGIQPGPELGASLEATLSALLDDEIGPGREAQLRFALASARR